MQQRQWGTWQRGAFGCAFILGMVACADSAARDGELALVHGDLSATSADESSSEAAGSGAAASDAALSTASSCDALLAQLQNGLLEQVQAVAEQARVSPDYSYYGGGVFIDDVAPALGAAGAPVASRPVASSPVASSPVASSPVASPPLAGVPSAGAPLTDIAAPAAAAGSAFAGSRFSETTVQVPGVDEADFVKAEGDRIYLLQGNSLYVLDARAANATQVVSSIALEGSPYELYVRDGQVVVTSSVSGPLPGQEVDDYYYYYYYYPSYAKLTVLDTRGDSIGVVRESYVEGYAYGSRRNDSVVRALVQQGSKVQLDYPSVSYFDIFGNRRSQAEIDLQVDLWVLLTTESIEDSVVEDYLPSRFERLSSGELVEQPVRCDDYLLPAPGLVNAGATTIVALDLDAPDASLGTTTFLGYADAVYANEDALIIRQTQYDYVEPIYRVNTNIHRFELDGAATTYSASGSISGYVAAPLGLDEVDGVIRTLATEDRYETVEIEGEEYLAYAGSANRVVTLGSEGGSLQELGRSSDVDTAGSLYGARFVDAYGYVSTYDYNTYSGALLVFDASNPEAPALAARVAQDGYLSMLQPLWGSQLLGIGEAIDPSGLSNNVVLSLLDVSDPTAPSISSEYVYGEYGYSEAFYDARALSIHPKRALFSLPFQNYDGQTRLDVFNVSSSGLGRVASITPTSYEPSLLECLTFLGYSTDPEFLEYLESDPTYVEYLLTECSYYYVANARRGLFRGDELFLVHTLGVDAYSVYNLSGPPVGEVELPPQSPYIYYPVDVSEPVPVPPPVEGEAPPSEGDVPLPAGE
ncbi:MAG TPA: beta-propeller domain-containing protein [Polyangiaceae bacterium]|nr:beta-propeller domain-containing protein [Polyangiaceae bacterium]